MTELLLLASATFSIVIARVIVAVAFAAVQWVVLRAFLRILHSLGLGERREKAAATAVFVLFAALNLPLVWFAAETFISPRTFLLYTPPPGYERAVRPFAYLFFVWVVGSLLFAAAAPVVMSLYA